MKKKILFVGEHPLGTTGNSGMLRSILSQVDITKYEMACFVIENGLINHNMILFNPLPFHTVTIPSYEPHWGVEKLMDLVTTADFDYLIMVGIDIWRYCTKYPIIQEIGRDRGFKFIHIFPYDIQELRSDWIEWINNIDIPCVYSQYGYDMLKDHVLNLEYFRPPIFNLDWWGICSSERREEVRKNVFGQEITKDDFIFGFVGPNQQRKDPAVLLKALSLIKKDFPNAYLYFHMNMEGHYNIIQLAEDYGLEEGDLFMKPAGAFFKADQIQDLYGSFDCYINCSLQEGLSWTIIEAMLCGTPVIGSDSTAHTELLEDAGILVPCENRDYISLYGKRGPTQMEAKSCNPQDVADAMRIMIEDKTLREILAVKGKDKADDWVKAGSNINDILKIQLTPVLEEPKETIKLAKFKEKIKAVLFAQHSAAGDVLMTTRCLKEVKKRHPDMELHYMTSSKYMDILKGNPYIDKVLLWKDATLNKYEQVYNPHGDRIHPGHWGRNSNSILSDFYWKILRVEPDNFFIQMDNPEIDLPDKFCVVHTTGGDAEFRTYKYMSDVCMGLYRMGFATVQLGGKDDYPAGADFDLRGQTFNQDAWVMGDASIAVTVDSFHAHLAGALEISQVTLFGSGNAAVVQPKQMGDSILMKCSPDYVMWCKGLGPCSASVRDCPIPCTGSHDPKIILEKIKTILELKLEKTKTILKLKG